jgi:general secretion pathway protein D
MIVKRMMDLVKELDVPVEGEKIWVVPLKNADADEVNKILTTIFSPKGPSPRPIVAGRPGSPPEEDVNTLSASKIVVDMASNSLIIVANATSFARIASLIKKLDVESDGVNQKINVYNLANGDAETMANTLGTLTGASVRNPGKRGTHGQNPRPPGGGAAVLFEAEVKISADKPTNSLVIVASPRDYLNLRGVIQKLDIPRRQVFVEATIMEISMNKNRKLGITYHGAGKANEGGGDSETLIFGGSEFGTDFNSLLMNPASLTGLAVGARTQPISGSGKFLGMSVDIPAFSVMLQAMQNNGNVNVLSSPHILTTDNEQAEITVGQNVPYPSGYSGVSSLASAAGSQASSLASLLPTVSVQRMDVALKLKLTPHVNESDMVRLELEQEVSDIIQENYNNLGPATSKRSAKTTIVARDQQTVVIGGLMSDRVNNSETKIPILGDIPIIGYFFKNTTKSLQKTNLLLVLTPYVIRDQSDLRRIFQKKEEERREFIERYTSFKPHDLGHEIDYRHKRGLLGEIYKVSEQIEQENKLLQDAHKKLQDTSEPVEMPNLPAPSSTGTPTPGDQNASPPTSIERMPPPTSIERMPSPVAPEMPRSEPQIQQ